MGTKSDYYVDGSSGLVWIGSLEYDGFRVAQRDTSRPYRKAIRKICEATTETEFRAAVAKYFLVVSRKLEEDGRIAERSVYWPPAWPWIWPTSELTDYVYVFGRDGLRVYNGAERTAYAWPMMETTPRPWANAARFYDHIARAQAKGAKFMKAPSAETQE